MSNPTCDIPFPPRRAGIYRKGMISARPSCQGVKRSVWDPETFAEARPTGRQIANRRGYLQRRRAGRVPFDFLPHNAHAFLSSLYYTHAPRLPSPLRANVTHSYAPDLSETLLLYLAPIIHNSREIPLLVSSNTFLLGVPTGLTLPYRSCHGLSALQCRRWYLSHRPHVCVCGCMQELWCN